MNSKTYGYIFALLALTIFSIQDGISKHLASNYPPVFVVMIRYWVFAVFTILMASRMRGGLRVAFRSRRPLLQIARGVLLATQVVMVLFCFAIIGLARSQAIFSATPLIVALLAIPLLGEKVGWRRWTAICVGMLGVLIILKPEGNFFDYRLLLALAASLVFAIYTIITRLVSRHDPSMISFLYTGVGGAVIITLIGPFYWTWFSGWDWMWMGFLCLTGISSHYLLIRAYEILDASAVQPLTYVQLVYASLIGMTIYGETLHLNTVIGSLLVVSAGIFTIWREHSLSRTTASLSKT